MDREQYASLSTEHFNDTDTYKKLEKDPTNSLQQKANKLISQLKNSNQISNEVAKSLTIYNATPPRYYGLPKVHKSELKLRPIVSSINSPNSKISKFTSDILTKSYNRENNFYTKSSIDFTRTINNFQYPPNFVLISLDVVSLYPSIPLELIRDSIKKRWPSISEHCTISEEHFIKLIDFIFESSYCLYNGIYYKQLTGTPMGSVISPILAQYVMDDLLEKCIEKLTFKMPFCKKYVDDIICMVPSNKVQETLTVFNSQHPKIQFTVEEEKDQSVPFLDVKIIRRETTLITDWYTKPTYSGRYINFQSYHATKIKTNFIINMKNKITQVSHEELIQNNLKKLYNTLRSNSYPANLLKKLIFQTPNPPEDRQQENTIEHRYKTLPYIEHITTRLNPLLKTSEEERTTYKTVKTVGSLFTRIKDKIPPLNQAGIVYKIPCVNCEKCYIGQTSRTLKARITSHKSDSKLNKRSCALAIHENETGHHMNYQQASVLDIEQNLFHRTFLEMVRIHQEDECINTKQDISGLSSIYTFLLDVDKHKDSFFKQNTHSSIL